MVCLRQRRFGSIFFRFGTRVRHCKQNFMSQLVRGKRISRFKRLLLITSICICIRYFTTSNQIIASRIVDNADYLAQKVLETERNYPKLEEKLRNNKANLKTTKKVLAVKNIENDRKSYVYVRNTNDKHACFDLQTNWTSKIVPHFKLNPDKFLVPTLYNGPNNQLLGFQQSVLVAILLNRTLVLPVFYYHDVTTHLMRRVAQPEERFEVSELRKLVSVIPMDAAVKLCDGKFDAVFMAEASRNESPLMDNVARIHLETGIQAAKYKKGISLEDIRRVYESSKYTKQERNAIYDADNGSILLGPLLAGGRRKLKDNMSYINTLYRSSAKCSLYFNPFRQLQLQPSGQVSQKWSRSLNDILRDPWNDVITAEDAGVLLHAVKQHTPQPVHVRELAQLFINSTLRINGPYIAIHWRYDNEDFFRYLCEDHLSANRARMCERVKKFAKPTALAQVIMSYVHKLSVPHQAGAVYMAAPPSLSALINSTKLEFEKLLAAENKSAVHFYASDSLTRFIQDKYSDCEMKSDDFLTNVLSETEMEICSNSDSFLWSEQSTWSSEATYRRWNSLGRSKRLDGSILGLIAKMADAEKHL